MPPIPPSQPPDQSPDSGGPTEDEFPVPTEPPPRYGGIEILDGLWDDPPPRNPRLEKPGF